MKIKNINEFKTAGEATQYAIDYQFWASEQDFSYNELFEWNNLFIALAEKFDLTEEFKENGII